MKVERIPVSGPRASGKVPVKGKTGGANGVAVAVALANGGNANGAGMRRPVAASCRRVPHPLRRRVVSSSGPIQRLFEACKQVFKGPGTVPSSEDVKKLRDILDTMGVEDVGLRRDLPLFRDSFPTDAEAGEQEEEEEGKSRRFGFRRKIIRTIIHNRRNMFELSIFILPAGAVIPLHNHPGMTVFSKLLLGSMHVKSYDWVDPAAADMAPGVAQSAGVVRLAKLKTDRDLSAPCSTSVLYPTTGGNMHTFTALTPCVILDVLGPPYSSEEGRDCSYYRDQPWSSSPPGSEDDADDQGSVHHVGGENRYALLEEVDEPADLFDLLFYMGPQVIDA